MQIPFRQIAIFDFNTLRKKYPLLEGSALLDFFSQWYHHASGERADCVLIRSEFETPAQIVPFIKDALKMVKIPVLTNYTANWHFSGTAGVHFRGNFRGAVEEERNYLMGLSCHCIDDLYFAEANGFDYVFYSPVFATDSHPAQPSQGLDNLRSFCKSSSIPVFALGGVNPQNAAFCLEAGAKGTVGISMYMDLLKA